MKNVVALACGIAGWIVLCAWLSLTSDTNDAARREAAQITRNQ